MIDLADREPAQYEARAGAVSGKRGVIPAAANRESCAPFEFVINAGGRGTKH